MTQVLCGLLIPGLILCSSLSAGPVDYVREVKPILKARCFACHGALKQESELRLDSGALIRKGGAGGPAVVPKEPASSPIIDRITAAEGERMPPEGAPLTPEQIAILKAWVEQGASHPETDAPEVDPRDHWAFRPAARPPLPQVRNPDWARNPVDLLLAATHDKRGLTATPRADKATLLRRVTLDLTGLPPTRDELLAFLADGSPEAYERVVDRLLDSPHYGERWGRHWMDVWRYSDWYGRRAVPDVMNSYPMIWRWRDWIVRSLNEDRGYDWMVSRMLAADEIDPESDADVVATGFIVRNWFKWNYNVWMRDQVEHTGKAFLGLTFNCAHCHDHKYDPISQEDYFRFRAFFEPLELRHDRVAGDPDPGPFQKYVYAKSYGPIKSGLIRVFDEKPDVPTFVYLKGDERKRRESPPVTPGMPASLGGTLTVTPVPLPGSAYYPGLKPFVQQEERASVREELAAAESPLGSARQAWESQRPTLEAALADRERLLQAAMQQALARSKSAPAGDPRGRVIGGVQSLLLDASQGRRVLGHKLAGLKGLADQGSVSLSVALLKDEHFNFQLALDVDAGLTGAFVTFEKGKIQTYAPGTFNVTDVGLYDFAGGQSRFQVTLKRVGEGSVYQLTVTSLSDGRTLVDNAGSEAHAWQPVADGKRGVFVDARPGTVAVIDDLAFTQPDGQTVLRFDFESPAFADGQEAAGVEGWLNTTFSVAPASSLVVSAVSGDPEVLKAAEAVRAAKAQRDQARLTLAAAEGRSTAAQAASAWVEARIAADNARYSESAETRAASGPLVQAAVDAERIAALARVRADVSAAEQALAAAEVPLAPSGDMARDQQQSQMQKAARDKAVPQLAAARAALAARESSAPAADYAAFTPRYPAASTGRRKALAEWLTRRDNPLTARVAVNHLWGWHFGRPLVETTFNFGRSGKSPTHPELLDWLAVELMESGWRMKPLHRLIVTSAAYQMRSSPDRQGPHTARNTSLDPDNHFLWRFNPARLEAEMVRDALLHASRELELAIGGPELDQSLGLTSRRRSLYFAHHGEERMKFLELFDAADPTDCYERTSSVTPQQALALSNSDLTHALGKSLAQNLWEGAAATDVSARETAFVAAAFEQILSRTPHAAEAELSLRFLHKQATALPASTADSAARARESFVQALLNHNDFVTIR